MNKFFDFRNIDRQRAISALQLVLAVAAVAAWMTWPASKANYWGLLMLVVVAASVFEKRLWEAALVAGLVVLAFGTKDAKIMTTFQVAKISLPKMIALAATGVSLLINFWQVAKTNGRQQSGGIRPTRPISKPALAPVIMLQGQVEPEAINSEPKETMGAKLVRLTRENA